jgi:HEAT repeat protein
LGPTPWERMRLKVLGRDEKRLADACERLAKRATEADYQVARAAALALRYVQDPVAVPYLDRVLAKGDRGVKGFAVAGLASIGTTDAINKLTSHLNSDDAQLRSQIQAALSQIRTGVKLEVND